MTAIISVISVGALGRLVVRGRRHLSIPVTIRIRIGIVAALAGTLLARVLGCG